jgi:hypothetical protein
VRVESALLHQGEITSAEPRLDLRAVTVADLSRADADGTTAAAEQLADGSETSFLPLQAFQTYRFVREGFKLTLAARPGTDTIAQVRDRPRRRARHVPRRGNCLPHHWRAAIGRDLPRRLESIVFPRGVEGRHRGRGGCGRAKVSGSSPSICSAARPVSSSYPSNRRRAKPDETRPISKSPTSPGKGKSPFCRSPIPISKRHRPVASGSRRWSRPLDAAKATMAVGPSISFDVCRHAEADAAHAADHG